MRRARIFVNGAEAGVLEELERVSKYTLWKQQGTAWELHPVIAIRFRN